MVLPLRCFVFPVLLFFSGSVNLWGQAAAVADRVRIDPTPLDRSLNGGVVSYAEILKEARPAVVTVFSRSTKELNEDEESLLERFFGAPPLFGMPLHGLGSGVIVSEDGYIITNHHVVGFADEIQVQLDNQRTYDATLVGTDPGTDIAVLKIDETHLPTLRLADSDQAQVGDVVFAIGNPLGVGKTVTMGIISATNRQDMGVIAGGFENFIQTDASINTGNSGGALVDAMGRLVGINTLIQTDGASSGNIGIGFAVPANLAYSVFVDLIQTGTVSRGFLGVGIESLDEEAASRLELAELKGALINLVSENSPAAEAGLKVGDVILTVDGEEVVSASDLRIRIAGRKPDRLVVLGVRRGSETVEFSVRLASRSESVAAIPQATVLGGELLSGVVIQPLDDRFRTEFGIEPSLDGMLVSEIDGNSPWAKEFEVGMLILKVNGIAADNFLASRGAMKAKETNRLLVYAEGAYRVLKIAPRNE